jgi:hypothetical protein
VDRVAAVCYDLLAPMLLNDVLKRSAAATVKDYSNGAAACRIAGAPTESCGALAGTEPDIATAGEMGR